MTRCDASNGAASYRMIKRAAAGAGLELEAHPHMLRHACGYALANKGHDTRAIQGMARPSVDHQQRRLHGAGAEPVQGLLAGLIRRDAAAGGLLRPAARAGTQVSRVLARMRFERSPCIPSNRKLQ
jgi:hypothetical protein